jgi:hypothetical protein
LVHLGVGFAPLLRQLGEDRALGDPNVPVVPPRVVGLEINGGAEELLGLEPAFRG